MLWRQEVRAISAVADGEIRRFVFGVEGVFDDVPLGDTKMFDKLVGRGGRPCGRSPRRSAGKSLTAASNPACALSSVRREISSLRKELGSFGDFCGMVVSSLEF